MAAVSYSCFTPETLLCVFDLYPKRYRKIAARAWAGWHGLARLVRLLPLDGLTVPSLPILFSTPPFIRSFIEGL